MHGMKAMKNKLLVFCMMEFDIVRSQFHYEDPPIKDPPARGSTIWLNKDIEIQMVGSKRRLNSGSLYLYYDAVKKQK